MIIYKNWYGQGRASQDEGSDVSVSRPREA